MFRVFVVVAVAAVPVIALGALAGPVWGAIAIGAELVAATWILWRRLRGGKSA